MFRVRSFILLIAATVAIAIPDDCFSQPKESSSRSQLDLYGGGVAKSGIWPIMTDGQKVFFDLGEEDMDVDFAVFSKGAKWADGGWKLFRWQRQGNKALLRVATSHSQQLLSNWHALAEVQAEFSLLDQWPKRTRIDATSLFQNEGAFFLRMADRSVGNNFEAPRHFERNAVLTQAISSENSQPEARVRWNFVRLPDDRMEKRPLKVASAFMHRGFLGSVARPDASTPEVILRWRIGILRADDPDRGVIDPVRIYVDPNTPERWRPWVREGIESWNSAFGSAGFENAVNSEEVNEVGGFSYDDLNVSTLCWKSGEECGWNVFDPRTGEILQSQLSGTAYALENFLARYVVTMASVDHRINEESIPDDLLGRFFAMVAAHEVGHMLGLMDGTYGTFTYSLDNVRDASWVRENGFSPSIMNYARFNYAIQPEDKMPLDSLLQAVGPSDHFWIAWGYSNRGEDELTSLWNSSSLHRFRRAMTKAMDPYDGIETIGVTDPVGGAELGMRNLERSISILVRKEYASRDPEIAGLLTGRALFDAALIQWRYLHQQVFSLIAGRLADPSLNSDDVETERNGFGGTPVAHWNYVETEAQEAAARAICSSFFADPPQFLTQGWLFDSTGLTRKEADDILQRNKLLVYREFLFKEKLDRLSQNQAVDAKSAEGFNVSSLIAGLESCIAKQVARVRPQAAPGKT